VKGLVLLGVALMVLGACARGSGPAPAPTENRFGAPVVTTPRDVRPFGGDPCAGPLTDPDWATLGFAGPGELRTLMVGEQSCVRRGASADRRMALIVAPTRDVLVDTYRVRQFALFRPSTVDGLPATVEQASAESTSCSVTVGTAEGQGFIVNYSEYELGPDGRPDDPCGKGQRVAERIVAALPPLAG
jgi:hypothetical protein